MQYVLLSATQILVLFILAGIGVAAAKLKMLDRAGVSTLTNLVLYFATPCVIIKAFLNISFTPELLGDLGRTAIFAVIATSLGFLAAYPIFGKETKPRKAVLRFATAFPNCAYIGIPLASELLGFESIAYLSAYIVIFNLFVWTLGVRLFHDKKKFSVKDIVLNPGIIGFAGGIIASLYGHDLPVLLSSPIGFIADINTPIAMLILGFYLSDFSFRIDKDTRLITKAIVLRQILIPAIAIGISWALNMRGLWLMASMVACVAPPAINVVMFAQKFGGDTKLAATLIAYANVICIITMPLLLGLCFQLFFQ